MDERLIKKLYWSIALAWAIAVSWTLAFQKPWIALSMTLGTLLGTASLASNDWVVRRAFTSSVRRPRRVLLKVGLLKYPAIALVLYFVVTWHRTNLLALVGGIALVYVAILAKALGIMVVERLNEDNERARANRS